MAGGGAFALSESRKKEKGKRKRGEFLWPLTFFLYPFKDGCNESDQAL
jgi:hypothetical protein